MIAARIRITAAGMICFDILFVLSFHRDRPASGWLQRANDNFTGHPRCFPIWADFSDMLLIGREKYMKLDLFSERMIRLQENAARCVFAVGGARRTGGILQR